MNGLSLKHTGRFFLGAFWMDFASAMYVVALPFFAMRLGAGSLELGRLGGVRSITYVVAVALTSGFADRHSRRAIMLVSTLSLALVLILSSGAGSLWQVGVGAALWALALAFYWPSFFSWLGDSHRAEALGRAAGTANLGWSTGGILGGMLAGWLFDVRHALPFLLAAVPALLACVSMLRVTPPQAAKRQPPAAGSSRPGARRRLAAAWIGNGTVCCMLGLMTGVFPDLGKTMGVSARLFGLLVALCGLVRTIVFLSGQLGAVWPRDWRASLATQVGGAGLVGIFGLTASGWMVALVFAGVGLCMGLSYYVSLYTSLEGGGGRGRKSGLHEAALMTGVTIGTLGGGAIAHRWGLHAPYVPIALLSVVMVVLQAVLRWSGKVAARRAVETPTQ